MRTSPAVQPKASAVTPAELARAIQLFKWGLEEMRKLSQRIDDLDAAVRRLARDGTHRDEWQRLMREVDELRESFRKEQASWENGPVVPK